MKKNKFILAICFLAIIILHFTACAQEHQQNKNLLARYNEIINQSVLLNNQQNFIPIKGLMSKHIASVNLGYTYQSTFDSLLNNYAKVDAVNGLKYNDSTHLNDLEDDLKYYNTIIIPINQQQAKQAKILNFIQHISINKAVVVALSGDGSALRNFDNLHVPIIWQTSNVEEAAVVIPQLIFGGIAINQQLKSDYSIKYKTGQGYSTSKIRLSYTVPEDAGVNSEDLNEISSIANQTINEKASPGLVVLVAKDGKVIYNKAFGTHTYTSNRKDKTTDIFDLASVTKITATTPSVMRLVEQGKLNLDTTIGYYIAKARNSPMRNIHVREVMLHQAGFIPYIPFQNYVKEGDYSTDSSAAFPTKVADNYYIKKDFFNDFMWTMMLNSPIKTRGKYVYSDISMYVMEDIIEHISQIPEDKYVQQNFYQPLGMQTAGFLPRNRFPKDRIVPTEEDLKFRHTLLEGYVHDQGAALKGGVAGHAGLFATANDLAIYYQMLLNKGTYGGEQYFKAATVEQFTSKQSAVSRRGLGFDRWDPDTEKEYPSKTASAQTYGHTGYTGIAAWVDPTRDLVYIFLSNRVNPQVSNKLLNLNIRSRIQDVINNAIDKHKYGH